VGDILLIDYFFKMKTQLQAAKNYGTGEASAECKLFRDEEASAECKLFRDEGFMI